VTVSPAEPDGFLLDGYFRDQLVLETEPQAITLDHPGDTAAFLARYDSDGVPLWALPVVDRDGVWLRAAADAQSGIVYAAGEFMGELAFAAGAPEEVRLTSNGTAGFVARFDADGHFQHAQRLTEGGDSRFLGRPRILSDGSLLLFGDFPDETTVSTPTRSITLVPRSDHDHFVLHAWSTSLVE